MGCLVRGHHNAAVGGGIHDGDIGQEDGAGTWVLLPILVPRVGELGQVGAPHKAGQVHQLPLLHGGLGPHLHTHSWGEKEGMGTPVRLCETSHLSP